MDNAFALHSVLSTSECRSANFECMMNALLIGQSHVFLPKSQGTSPQGDCRRQNPNFGAALLCRCTSTMETLRVASLAGRRWE